MLLLWCIDSFFGLLVFLSIVCLMVSLKCFMKLKTSASFLMASPTFSFPMLKAFAGSMWLFWLHSVLRLWFLSRFLLFMLCRNCLLPHLHLCFRFSQPELLKEWRMKVISPPLLLWPGFCQTYRFLEEDQRVWSHLTFMLCRCAIGRIAFYNCSRCVFGWMFVICDFEWNDDLELSLNFYS